MHFLNLTDHGFILHPTMLADLKGFYRTIAQFTAQFEKTMGQTVIKLFFSQTLTELFVRTMHYNRFIHS